MDMGATAEKLARERGISREDSDRFALESHKRAIRAQKEGLLAEEIQPVTIEYTDGSNESVDTDQNPREDTTLERLGQLKPSYRPDGLVTAGNGGPAPGRRDDGVDHE